MAGPGAITATVLLAGRSEGDPMRLTILLAVIAFVAALCAAGFLLGTHIGRLLGVTGNIVLSRLLGVLLAALAVQFVIDGAKAVFAG
jgi:multiple antibiotic resistance protein